MTIFKQLDAFSQLQVNELVELLSRLSNESSNDNVQELANETKNKSTQINK